MKQLWLIPLSLVFSYQGFCNEVLEEEKVVVLAPDEHPLSENTNSLRTEFFEEAALIANNRYDLDDDNFFDGSDEDNQGYLSASDTDLNSPNDAQPITPKKPNYAPSSGKGSSQTPSKSDPNFPISPEKPSSTQQSKPSRTTPYYGDTDRTDPNFPISPEKPGYNDPSDEESYNEDIEADPNFPIAPKAPQATITPSTSKKEGRSYRGPTNGDPAAPPSARQQRKTQSLSKRTSSKTAQAQSYSQRPSSNKLAQTDEDMEYQSPSSSPRRERTYYGSPQRSYQREQGRLQAQNSSSRPVAQRANKSSQQGASNPPAPTAKMPEGINIPVRPVVQDGWNLWILGEALWWQAVQENMEYVYKSSDDSNNATIRDIKNPEFEWNWGFRFGAGYNIPRDGWDLSLIWTHIENRAHGTTHAEDESLFNVWTVAAFPDAIGTISKAKAHWEVHLDQIDFDLGRQFFVGKYLTLRPNVGVRSSWIFQDYHVHLDGSDGDQKNTLKNRFWGFGFFAGLDSDWKLGAGFSIFGDAGVAVLLGFFDVDQHGSVNDSRIYDLDKSTRTGRAILDLDLGLKWAKKFYQDRYALTLKAGYEYHLYFNQNQFLQSTGSTNLELFNPVNGDLSYQGLTLSGQFDF